MLFCLLCCFAFCTTNKLLAFPYINIFLKIVFKHARFLFLKKKLNFKSVKFIKQKTFTGSCKAEQIDI